MRAHNYEKVEKLFQRCLIKILNIDLWRCYLQYIKDTKASLPTFKEKMAQVRIINTGVQVGTRTTSPSFTRNQRKSQWEFLEKRCWTAFWLGRLEQYPAISRYACDMRKTLTSKTEKYMSYHTDLYR